MASSMWHTVTPAVQAVQADAELLWVLCERCQSRQAFLGQHAAGAFHEHRNPKPRSQLKPIISHHSNPPQLQARTATCDAAGGHQHFLQAAPVSTSCSELVVPNQRPCDGPAAQERAPASSSAADSNARSGHACLRCFLQRNLCCCGVSCKTYVTSPARCYMCCLQPVPCHASAAETTCKQH